MAKSRAWCPRCKTSTTSPVSAGTAFDCDACSLRSYTLPMDLKPEKLGGPWSLDLHLAYMQLARGSSTCRHSDRGELSPCLDCAAKYTALAIEMTRVQLGEALSEFLKEKLAQARKDRVMMTAEELIGHLDGLSRKWVKGSR